MSDENLAGGVSVRFDTNQEIDAYRVGQGPRGAAHWAWPWHVDLWMRSWQAEWRSDCLWAPRAWTKAGVTRKARRWRKRNTDLRKHERRYGRNPVVRAQRGLS